MDRRRLARDAPLLYRDDVHVPTRTLVLTLLGVLCVPGSTPAAAQLSGSVPVRTGFTPDPAVFPGTAAGGGRLLEAAGEAACGAGFFGREPSHVLDVETRVGFMRIYATSSADLVIAVRDGEGRWRCNDDTYGRHPSVEGTWLPGRVLVYVGTHDALASVEYELRLTETRSMRPGAGPEGGEAGDETGLARDAGLGIDDETGRFDGIRLRRGFLPDPRYLAGHTEPDDTGTVDVSVLGGDCHGFTPGAPAHLVTLQDDFDYLQLYVVPLMGDRWATDEAPGVSLVVLGPDGRFACDRGDEDGVEYDAATWGPGLYRVWVGSTEEGLRYDYRLGISEIRRVR